METEREREKDEDKTRENSEELMAVDESGRVGEKERERELFLFFPLFLNPVFSLLLFVLEPIYYIT